MSYTLVFKDQSVDPIGKAPITVAVGTVNSTAIDLKLTGKGAANFGKLQQENLIRLLENFASGTAPSNPTVGQLWYDSSKLTLKVLIDSSPTDIWKSLGGVQITGIGAPAPAQPSLGDMWFQQTGTSSGFSYVYTGLGRYPTTAVSIGGWEQTFPRIDTAAGREEYDSIRELVEQLVGEGVSSYGSGAIGRMITNLTDFGELDRDLRLKYGVFGADLNVLISISADQFITSQALSSTLFLLTDTAGAGPNDFIISGSRNNTTLAGTIFVDNVGTTVPAGVVFQDKFVEDAFVMWDQFSTINPAYDFWVVRINPSTGFWEFDDNTDWTVFTPVSTQYIIGTISTFQEDVNTITPGGKNGFIWAHAVPISGAKDEHLKVEPNSQDWDTLLAAAKYGLGRLELPSGFANNISGNPFVNDGRRAPTSLTAFSTTDIRYPTGTRRSNRRIGTVSQMNSFNETVNALNTGISNRFSLKGINGATGSNSTFASSTSVSTIAGPLSTASNAPVAGTRTLTITASFNNHDEFYRWMGAGHGLQIDMTQSGATGNPADVNLRNALNEIGVLRVTADKVRVLGQSLPLTMTKPVSNLGIWNGVVVDGAIITADTLLRTETSNSATMTVSTSRTDVTGLGSSTFIIKIVLNAGSPFLNTTSVTVSEIYDTTVVAAVSVYPRIDAIVLAWT